MKFNQNTCWDDTVKLISANREIVAAIAGVFLILPNFIFKVYVPEMPSAGEDAGLSQILSSITTYYQAHFVPIFLLMLVTATGALSLLVLFLDRNKPTVGAAIILALSTLLSYIVANWLSSIAVTFGLIALVVPGLYLIGRLALFGPVIIGENQKNPISALVRSWDLTRGNGWSVVLIILIVAIVGLVIIFVTSALFGLLFKMAGLAIAPKLLSAVLDSGLTVVLITLYAAIYRQLSAPVVTPSAQ